MPLATVHAPRLPKAQSDCDAINLSGKLHRVIRGESADLLDRYHRQRHSLVAHSVIPQATENRARMETHNSNKQQQKLAEFRAIAGDVDRCRAFLFVENLGFSLESVAYTDDSGGYDYEGYSPPDEVYGNHRQ